MAERRRGPPARVLDRPAHGERTAFLKAMDMLEAELRNPDTPPSS